MTKDELEKLKQNYRKRGDIITSLERQLRLNIHSDQLTQAKELLNMTEYSKLLKHLGINKNLMVADMQSRIADCEKPYLLKRCKDFETCRKGKNGCRGCNVWNYLYDIEALKKWCKEQGKNFMLFTMKMHKKLKQE